MWESLYEKQYSELVRYAMSVCKNQAEAEDAAQEVFVRAMQQECVLEELSPSQRRGWLYRSLKNLLCDRFRHGRLEETYLVSSKDEMSVFDPGLEEVENRMLLARLSPEDRVLFHLRYEEGYNASELSEIFGVPSGTIRARLSRIRKTLKTMIE